MIRTLLREPLVHYLGLGIVLFAGYALLSGGDDSGADQLIQVTENEVRWLADAWQGRWQRPPTQEELRGLVDAYVREEVLYREALAVGLDRDDQVIRRRLVQKLEFITEDLASQVQPSDLQFQAYFNENLDRYRMPERRSFQHVYFNADRRGVDVESDAEEVLERLRATSPSFEEAVMLGDRIMLEYAYSDLSEEEVARQFGGRFAESLFQVEPGEWQGPIGSGLGLHLVRVVDVVEGRAPELSEVRDEVLRDYESDLRNRASQALYDNLRIQYQIEIDDEAIRRLSMRQQGERGGS
jgi:hypothetical protein